MTLKGRHEAGEIAALVATHGGRPTLKGSEKASICRFESIEDERVAQTDLDHAVAEVKDGNAGSQPHGSTMA